MSKRPNLDPSLAPRTRYEDINDFDYLHKLDGEALDFMDKFLGEYVGASFDKKNKNNLHKKKKQKKECGDRNNARNRCLYTRVKAGSALKPLEDAQDITVNPEEALIGMMDIKGKKKC